LAVNVRATRERGNAVSVELEKAVEKLPIDMIHVALNASSCLKRVHELGVDLADLVV
jgi:hypothetical protein